MYSRDEQRPVVTPWEFDSDEASSPSHCDFGKEQKAGGKAARVYEHFRFWRVTQGNKGQIRCQDSPYMKWAQVPSIPIVLHHFQHFELS